MKPGAIPMAPLAAARRSSSLALSGALAVLGVAYAVFLGSLGGLPFQDSPNHLARAVVSADLLFHGGARFGDAYAFDAKLSPYLLHDLALASLVEVLGPYAAGRVFTVLVAASLPLAVAIYLRTTGSSPRAVLVGTVLSLYLATDWFFVVGFHAFRLAVALTLLTLAAWQAFLASGSRRALAAYAACLAAGYLTHLSALLFGAAGAALVALVALLRGKTSLSRVALGTLPVLVLAAAHLASTGVAPPGETVWNPAILKLKRLSTPFYRYDAATEVTLLALLAAACAPMLAGWRRAWRSGRVLVPAALAVAFLAMYAAMPVARGAVWLIDSRALPLAALFAVLAALAIADQRRGLGPASAVLAVALAAANLAVLRAHLGPHDAAMLEYREVAARVPAGAVVMPIATRPPDGDTRPLLHAGLFATIDAGAKIPYMFTGGVTPYFTERRELRAPPPHWYELGGAVPDSAAIADTYGFLLVTKPFERDRIPVAFELVAQNETAALLRVVRVASAGVTPAAASPPPRAPRAGPPPRRRRRGARLPRRRTR